MGWIGEDHQLKSTVERVGGTWKFWYASITAGVLKCWFPGAGQLWLTFEIPARELASLTDDAIVARIETEIAIQTVISSAQ